MEKKVGKAEKEEEEEETTIYIHVVLVGGWNWTTAVIFFGLLCMGQESGNRFRRREKWLCVNRSREYIFE